MQEAMKIHGREKEVQNRVIVGLLEKRGCRE
jgi:hypothetical protein